MRRQPRADLHQLRPVNGDPRSAGAIGNAAWSGVSLAEILRAANITAGSHVACTSADQVDADGAQTPYAISIPIAKATSPEVLLAFEMNGAPLAPAHGHPLRLVVPGFAGVRSPKWLARITVQHHPAEGPIQARDYKLMPPHITPATVDWAAGITINEMPLTSAICDPPAHATLPPGPATLRGYALATARAIARVDVSADNGRTWSQATLEPGPDAPWSWTFWSATLDLPPGQHTLAVRAWDSAGQTQPSLPDDTWNFKGYLGAAWHRIPVVVG